MLFLQDYEDNNYVGEKMLLASILRRAAFDIALYRDSKRLILKKRAKAAFDWMFNSKNTSFMAFETICEVLDQDPEWIREQTLKLTRADVKRFDRSSL